MEESRKQFESVWSKDKSPFTEDDELKQFAWGIWQESRNAAEIELPDMNSKRYVEHGTDFDFLQYRMDLEDAIRAAGLRVKEK
ncbi:hypothetical protein [Phytobacter diazotrophicus]|uniref:hypothetical protein n=1 Tax=Phytobacter diazotrophicus TaxID=395631 RepID=UPI002FFAABF4